MQLNLLVNLGHDLNLRNLRPLIERVSDFNEASIGHELQFAIGPNGHTKDLHVAQSDPAGLFDQAALTAVSSWLYHPLTQNGRPVAQDANAVNLTFEPPAPEPSYKPEAFYNRAQYEAHQEGSATIAFDITPAGLTTNLAVVKSNPPGVFDKNALESVRTWQYAPEPPDKPYPRQTAEIAFKLAEAMLPPIPQSRHALEYPAAAADAGIMGNCIVGYWIEPDGTTSDVHIISCTPSGFFEDATLKYARNATYRIEADPRLNRRRYHCISVKFRFPGVTRSDMSYLKPGEWIKLRFTRTTAGRARNIEVIGQSSPNVPPPAKPWNSSAKPPSRQPSRTATPSDNPTASLRFPASSTRASSDRMGSPIG